jgi:hypothetical protein
MPLDSNSNIPPQARTDSSSWRQQCLVSHGGSRTGRLTPGELMDVFDFSIGSLYGILAIASCIYLLRGFTFRLRPMVKAIIAADILADLLFSRLLLDLPVYRFIRSLTAEDRIYPLLVLMGCVVAMDAGAALFAARLPRRRAPEATTSNRGSALPKLSRPVETAKGNKGPGDLVLKVNEKRARQVGTSFLLLALLSRFSGLLLAGILGEGSLLDAILTWQPERSLGYSFLEMAGSTFFPMGLALLVMASKAKRHWMALIAMMLFGFFSPWKSGISSLLIVYGLALYCFDQAELRRLAFKRYTIVLGFALILFIGVKTQFRNLGRADFDAQSIMENVVAVVSGHTAGIFQSYAYVIGSLERGYPLMHGQYNAQAFYLWVPRLLWEGKPRVAAEEIYYYLELTKEKDEPYGTAFAITVFGAFYLDFGVWGSLVCSFLFGGASFLGENFMRRWRQSRNHVVVVGYVVLSTVWLNSAFALCEGGLPPAFTGILFSSVLGGAVLLFWSLVKVRQPSVPAVGRPHFARVRG